MQKEEVQSSSSRVHTGYPISRCIPPISFQIIVNAVNAPRKFGGRNSLSKKLQLILFGVVGLNGLDLDDDCGISLGEGLAFCCDSAGYITRG